MSTNINTDNFPLRLETESIINVCLEVHKHLGHGFLEIVYKDAMELEFHRHKTFYEREKEFPIFYKNILLDHKFYTDFVVFNSIILEIKSKTEICDEDLAQAINYLKCSGCKVGLVLNFGRKKLEIKRVVY
ncbi:hypothetical protein GALL_102750 [mine drainage metagenome]|uniref:GxxExxY protein n=1 Tax=mine drainage metagenome TaxID=410659 RepID=A0A1J5T195_9ZZZZ